MNGWGKGVGGRIRLYRKNRGLSLTDLSRLTGIAASNLSSIELNKTSPTLNTLVKIADAFQMKVGTFLDEALYQPVVFCPAYESVRKASQTKGVSIAELTNHVQKSQMHVREIKVGCKESPFTLCSERDSFIYCLRGMAKIMTSASKHLLRPGDGIYIRAFTDAECTAEGEDDLLLLAISGL